VRAARTAPSSTGSTHMMTFDYGGDGEPRGNAQLGLHHHPRVVHPPLKRRRGKLCCLSARPPDIADLTGTRPRVVVVSPSIVPCVYSKRAALTRSLSLGCRFVDRNVALLSHPVPQTAVLYGRTQKRHAQEHRVENWSYSAAPVRAAGADQAKMAWLAAGSKALLYCFRFSAGCCLAAASAAALDLHRLLAAAHPQMRPRGRPESSAGASDKPALSFSWFSLCVAAASGVSFVRIITSHSSVNPLL